MKIQIIGFSGSGKSTLANNLGRHYNIPVLHLDSLHFKENWVEEDNKIFNDNVEKFLNENTSWVIDGNYRSIAVRRFTECDLLIFLDYNRFFCYKEAKNRYKKYKGKTREDMAPGCNEKLDHEFKMWLLFKGRTRKRRKRLLSQCKNHPNSLIFKNRKALFKYLEANNIEFER